MRVVLPKVRRAAARAQAAMFAFAEEHQHVALHPGHVTSALLELPQDLLEVLQAAGGAEAQIDLRQVTRRLHHVVLVGLQIVCHGCHPVLQQVVEEVVPACEPVEHGDVAGLHPEASAGAAGQLVLHEFLQQRGVPTLPELLDGLLQGRALEDSGAGGLRDLQHPWGIDLQAVRELRSFHGAVVAAILLVPQLQRPLPALRIPQPIGRRQVRRQAVGAPGQRPGRL
mmetsp:Transcript_119574/g.283984  ORF Transcript_119574/g.283984 Transcript_119574/m.283984 type:complete len:226 (-) Transcript_119574:137-814(-)